jgi:acyl carrier protein
MQQSEIYSALTDVFRDVFENDSMELAPAVNPSQLQGWDSSRYVTLIVATESRFGIKFRPAELESLRTVDDFVQRIGGKLKN